MNSKNSPSSGDVPSGLLLTHGGYERLRSYQVAVIVYDATVVFCDRFISRKSRTHDQMVQAARSGVRNISEGSGAAATSRKSELKLTNVARASLNDELLADYKSFLLQKKLRIWEKDSPDMLVLRRNLSRNNIAETQNNVTERDLPLCLQELPEFVGKAPPEIAANAMICVINQVAYLLKRQLESLAKNFENTGGFTENLYRTRIQKRQGAEQSPPGPPCPLCGKSTRQRLAKKGPKAGQSFWGCTEFPNCRGIIDGSD